MFAVHLKTVEQSSRLFFEQSEIAIGRVEGNDIVLSDENVSRWHCKLLAKGGRYLLIDLNSTNGVFVNRLRIENQQAIKLYDEIRIGQFLLSVVEELGSTARERYVDPAPAPRSAIPFLVPEPISLPRILPEPLPQRAILRRILDHLLMTDADLDAFCLDYFPAIKRRFTQGMERTAKVSMLLEQADLDEIESRLIQEHGDKVRAALLKTGRMHL